LHTFHDWLAEERLRELWISLQLVDDGAKAHGSGRAGAESVRRQAALPTNRTALAERWAEARTTWVSEQKALRRIREKRKRSGVEPGDGDYSLTTTELLNGSQPLVTGDQAKDGSKAHARRRVARRGVGRGLGRGRGTSRAAGSGGRAGQYTFKSFRKPGSGRGSAQRAPKPGGPE